MYIYLYIHTHTIYIYIYIQVISLYFPIHLAKLDLGGIAGSFDLEIPFSLPPWWFKAAALSYMDCPPSVAKVSLQIWLRVVSRSFLGCAVPEKNHSKFKAAKDMEELMGLTL